MSAAQSLFCIVKKPLGGHMKAAVSRKRPRGAMGSGTRVLGATATSPRREVKEVGDAVRGLQVNAELLTGELRHVLETGGARSAGGELWPRERKSAPARAE